MTVSPRQLTKVINYWAQVRNIPPALIKAIIYQESRFNQKALRYEPHLDDSSYGLMQILSKTARGMGFTGPVALLYDPMINLKYATKFLKDMIVRFKGHLPDALSAYNAGSGNVEAGKRYVNPEYVQSVLKLYAAYSRKDIIKPMFPLPLIIIGLALGITLLLFNRRNQFS